MLVFRGFDLIDLGWGLVFSIFEKFLRRFGCVVRFGMGFLDSLLSLFISSGRVMGIERGFIEILSRGFFVYIVFCKI